MREDHVPVLKDIARRQDAKGRTYEEKFGHRPSEAYLSHPDLAKASAKEVHDFFVWCFSQKLNPHRVTGECLASMRGQALVKQFTYVGAMQSLVRQGILEDCDEPVIVYDGEPYAVERDEVRGVDVPVHTQTVDVYANPAIRFGIILVKAQGRWRAYTLSGPELLRRGKDGLGKASSPWSTDRHSMLQKSMVHYAAKQLRLLTGKGLIEDEYPEDVADAPAATDVPTDTPTVNQPVEGAPF